jgi:hypothetical protein
VKKCSLDYDVAAASGRGTCIGSTALIGPEHHPDAGIQRGST